MVVWVLRKIHYCILLDVIVTNDLSIMKDLLLYFIGWNCDEWLYEYTKDLLLYFIECIYDEWLHEYYEGSIVVLYWILIVMNGWMSNTKGVLLWYWMLNCYGMFVCVLQRIYYCVHWMLNYYGTHVRVSQRAAIMLQWMSSCYESFEWVIQGILTCYSDFINHLYNVWLIDDWLRLMASEGMTVTNHLLVSANGIRMDDWDKSLSSGQVND
jgi:hypothetical protein